MPAAYKDIEAAVRNLGMTVESDRGKGGHRVVLDQNGKFVTVLAFHGSGKQINNSTVRALARQISSRLGGFDEAGFVNELTGRPVKSKVAAK